MRTVIILCSLVTLLNPVSCCEQNYYGKDGKCCKMCGPGKRMLVDDNCEDPRCQDCQDGEYQSGYTSQTKCEPQPSCDPNLHFKQLNPSKTELIKCQCEDGYFCTEDDDCNTCRKHTVCKPGQRVVKKGSSKSDTVCEACKNETFSNDESADTCQPWTICEYGYDKNTPGSLTSDRICLDGTPSQRYVIVVIVAVVFTIILGAVGLYIAIRQKWCTELPKQAEKITGIHIRRLHEDTDVERAVQPLNQQPEEDDDDSIPVSPTTSNITENGNPVQQEHGKESVSSLPESNPFS
ncbi:tumor necrosis factor receptor superfamily member 5 [Garra rufa]|uniref:tumor necrosis factor receptor superfamily member 5 n=1 Tax=Garra rufa TaxID=137080 RepID=UPI003CCE87AC